MKKSVLFNPLRKIPGLQSGDRNLRNGFCFEEGASARPPEAAMPRGSTILTFLFLLIALEFGLSLVFYFKDAKNPLILSDQVKDFPYVYYAFKAGKEINGDGLYSRYSREKEKGVFRIMLLGGSTARGMFASSQDNTISGYLEKALEKEFTGIDFEVINAGMSGYVVEQLFIFYQLVLDKYHPDMVIGFNGYNDLISVKLNRYVGIYSAPQNMRQFMVIEMGREKKKFSGRLSNVFPSIFRAADSVTRSMRGEDQYDFSAFDASQIKEAGDTYVDIIKDLHSLCSANNVIHLEFLQPIKWFIPREAGRVSAKDADKLIALYGYYENELSRLGYGHSLAGALKERPDFFIDDCHISDKGNEAIASLISIPVKRYLSQRTRRKP